MELQEILESTIKKVLVIEKNSAKAVASYIAGNGKQFGICEEPDDLTLLEQSYE